MKRNEFIEWLDNESDFYREYNNDDDYWLKLVNYDELIYDYLNVSDNYVDYTYENMYWGGSNIVKENYSFEEFIRKYNDYSLK